MAEIGLVKRFLEILRFVRDFTILQANFERMVGRHSLDRKRRVKLPEVGQYNVLVGIDWPCFSSLSGKHKHRGLDSCVGALSCR